MLHWYFSKLFPRDYLTARASCADVAVVMLQKGQFLRLAIGRESGVISITEPITALALFMVILEAQARQESVKNPLFNEPYLINLKIDLKSYLY